MAMEVRRMAGTGMRFEAKWRRACKVLKFKPR